MTPRKKILLFACLVLAGVVVSERGPAWRAPSSAIAFAPGRVDRPMRAPAEDRAAPPREISPRLTRPEAAAYVRTLYRREQLARELALEQRRYGSNYWESPPGDFDPRQLQRDREALLA